jgi:alpha-tubulin suppressor-like RCC1 family protein
MRCITLITCVVTLQIESLWGRAEVTSMALGDAHTLYLDSNGSIWSCGENKEVRGPEAYISLPQL